MTIIERALQFVTNDARIGLGSGRAAQAFVRALGERVRNNGLRVRGVPTSDETARLAQAQNIPLQSLSDAGILDATIDGADEVDPNLDLIKGYGRALLREKIVAACSRRLIILIGEEKLVPQLGTRGKLPVEITPFALPLCERRLAELGCRPTLYRGETGSFTTDNGNLILDCELAPIANPRELETVIQAIPGVVGTGLFLGMADMVLVGEPGTWELRQERQRPTPPIFDTAT